MLLFVLRVCLALSILSVSLVCVADIVVIDDVGNSITLKEPAQRIVSLAPHVTELLFAVGAGDQIVGADAFSNYPQQAITIPRVGDAMRLDRERIIALHPDLVIAWGSGNPASELAALRDFGIPMFTSEPRRIDDIPRQLELIGKLTGHSETGKQLADEFRTRVVQLSARYGHEAPLKIFYQISGHPLFTVNGEHLISEVIRFCGGKNIFAELASLAPSISLESVVAAAPEVILFGAYPGQRQADVDSQWDQWQTIPAVSHEQIYGVPVDVLHRAGPRVLEGVERVCAALETAHKLR